jgi:predicted alpha/beta superfamily hydrolase
MEGTIKDFSIGEYQCSLYLPPGYDDSSLHYPVVYVNGGEGLAGIIDGIEGRFKTDCREFLLLGIQPVNWNDDFSPWPAPAVYQDGEAFGGGALKYLDFLIHTVKPFIDAAYRTEKGPQATVLAGYSLGGLAALYSLYTGTVFGKIACLSGSLWFEGWQEFMEDNVPLYPSSTVYLSLGREEEKSRNRSLAKVGDCTRKAAELLKRQLKSEENLILEWNDGGHFKDIEGRFQKALLWLMKKEPRDQS